MANYTSIHKGSEIDGAITYIQNLVANLILASATTTGYLTSSDFITFSNKLDSSAYTANDILSKLLTVDGTGSGVDADKLDGNEASAFSLTGHNHSGVYEPILTKYNLSGTGSQINVSGGTNSTLENVTLSLAATPIVDGLEISSSTINTVPIFNSLKQLVSSNITNIELSYLSGITSAIQSQLNSKEPTVTKGNLTGSPSIEVTGGTGSVIGTGTSLALAATPIIEGLEITSLTGDRAVYIDSLKQLKSSSITNTELGYLSGVTSGVQSQLSNIDAARINSGTIDIARLPATVIERMRK
jgi:hypothetical protein